MRRGVGIGAIKKKQDTEVKFKDKGTEFAGVEIELLSSQMATFQKYLEDFAAKHRNEMKKSATFRRQFQEMCASIGVDPLASSKGFWTETLGVGDFYYELAVQIIEVCFATNHLNGGLITLNELQRRLISSRSRTRTEDISSDDILRAIGKLKVLGSGFSAVQLDNGSFLVRSIPGELTMDHTRVLQCAEEKAFVTVADLASSIRWDRERIQHILDQLVQEGFCWIDLQHASGQPAYWFPTLFTSDAKLS